MRRLAADLGEFAAPLLSWLDGHGAGDPEPLWREASAGFAALGEELWAARAALDLARLRLAAGRPREAAALASEVASILGAAAASAEDLAAIQALNRAATVAEVSGEDLDGAEAVLKRLESEAARHVVVASTAVLKRLGCERRTRRALDLAL